MSPQSAARRTAGFAVLLGVLVAGYVVFAALAAPPVPAPSISVFPANPTNSTSASFTYTDSVAVTRFECSMDSTSSYSTCGTLRPSSKSYSGLSAGSHTFRVRAVTTSGTSASTSFTWLIDRMAPTASIVFPANNGVYNAASYNAGCSPTGICGSAADPAGVASVRLSIRRGSTGKYWNGSGFSLSAETFLAVSSGTTSWKYGLVLQPDDTYTVHVQATDSLGNAQTGTTYAASSSFKIDTTPPPAPSVTSGPFQYPPLGWASTSATFQFSDSESGVSFLCSLDGGAYVACVSPTSYSGLAQGTHTFRVEAKDAPGNISAPSAVWTWFVDTVAPNKPTLTSFPPNPSSSTSATFAWTDTDPAPGSGIAAYFCKLDGGSYQLCSSPKTYTSLSLASHTFSVVAVDWAGNTSQAQSYTWTVSTATGQPYTISGNVSTLLYPGGLAVPINLTFNNPNAGNGGSGVNGVQVSNLNVSITSITGPNITIARPCTTADYAIVQFSGSYPFYIPQGTSSLSTLTPAIPSGQWPSIRLINKPTVNQDGCKNATINLSYVGTP